VLSIFVWPSQELHRSQIACIECIAAWRHIIDADSDNVTGSTHLTLATPRAKCWECGRDDAPHVLGEFLAARKSEMSLKDLLTTHRTWRTAWDSPWVL
jgi:hypothetical protein